MKKLCKKLKRITASALICFMLSFSSVTGYLAYTAVPVQASVTAPLVLAGLLEAVFASMGLTLSSRTDLDNMVTSLDGIMEANPSYTYDGVLIFDDIKEAVSDAVLGAKVKITTAAAEWLSKWLYNSSSTALSSFSDVRNLGLSLAGTEIVYGDFSEEFFNSNDLFYGCSLSNASGESITLASDSSIFDSNVVVTVRTPLATGFDYSLYYLTAPCILYPSVSSTKYYIGAKEENENISKFAYYDTYITGYQASGSVVSCKLADGTTTDDEIIKFSNRFCTSSSNLGFLSVSVGGSGYLFSKAYWLPVASDSAYVRMFVNNGTKFYNSYAEYQMIEFNTISPTSAVYGATASSKSLETDEEDESKVVVQIPESSITSSVEKAVSNALASNPSITDAELNALAADQIAILNGIKDSVEDNTEVLGSLTDIMSSVREYVKQMAEILTGEVTAYYEDMTSWAEELTEYIYVTYEEFLAGVKALPDEIAEALAGSAAVPGETTDEATAGILELLQQRAMIDTAAISAAAGGFGDMWETKFPFLPAIKEMFEEISFPDVYAYPVIKMQTPDIIYTFYKEDYIILCDFSNYKDLLAWCRNLVKAMIWVGFAYSLFEDIKTRFSIG